MIEKSKIYTAADFERYYSGTMPVDEMYELEKAALEDPFLADALEGYTYAPSFSDDVNELKEKLNEKQKKKKVFFIASVAQSGWWRIAALFVIIAGASYFFYKTNYKNKENSLARNEMKSIVQKRDSAISNTDTTSSAGDLAFGNKQLNKEEERKKNTSPGNKPFSERQTAANNKINATASALASENHDKYSTDSIKLNMKSGEFEESPGPPYKLKGKVTDETGKPLAFATIKNNSKNEVTLTDTAGKFLLPSADSSATAIVSVTGYGTKKADLQKDKEPTITLNKSKANISEMATPSSQSKKLTSAVLKETVLRNEDSGIRTTAFPTLDNTTAFNEYLKENTKPVFDEKNNKLSGEVLLSFTVNKKGRPHNIKVIKSSCKACEKEAVKLLESGPDWINENQNLKTVIIKF